MTELLQVRDLVKSFPLPGGDLRHRATRASALDARRGRRQPRGRATGDPGPRGRVRQRQDHAGAVPGPAHRARLRDGHVRRTGRVRCECGAAATHPASDAAHLPGSVLVAQPAASPSGDAIAEPARVHGLVHGRAAARALVEELLDSVGLSRADAQRRPRQLSGGQRQRVAIARALALQPELLIADEAVSALDVSVQAQILNLFADLAEHRHLAMIFVSHQLAVIAQLAQRVAIMYRGRIVETGSTADGVHGTPASLHVAAAGGPSPCRASRRRVVWLPPSGTWSRPPPLVGGCRFRDPLRPRAADLCRGRSARWWTWAAVTDPGATWCPQPRWRRVAPPRCRAAERPGPCACRPGKRDGRRMTADVTVPMPTEGGQMNDGAGPATRPLRGLGCS